MEVLEVDPTTYESYLPVPYVIFNSVKFNQLNSPKCDAVKYLVFANPKPRFGLIAGVRAGHFLSPFSAPFGGFSKIADAPRMAEYLELVESLVRYAEGAKLCSISITLPPTIYQDTFITKQANALLDTGFQLQAMDVNSSFSLKNFDENYLEKIAYSAKKNYKTAVRNGLEFHKAVTAAEIELVYEIIKINRESKGRQVKMSFNDVIQTSKIVPVDFFLVLHQDKCIASAVVYQVSEQVVQVVYWGSLPEAEAMRPTNFLSYHLWEYYQKLNFDLVDIGPSSQQGKADTGLVDFKETLGCELSMKLSFYKEFSQ